MTLIKVQHDKNNPYTIINKSIVDDSRISYKAIGIWLYAFSKKEDWQFYLDDLSRRHTDKTESVRSGLKELEDAGYLYRYKKKNEKCQFKGWEWIFFETPKSESEIKEMFPTEGFSLSRETPNSVKPPCIISNDSIDNKEDNNNPVVCPFLSDLDLGVLHKIRLSQRHPPETLRIAVQRVLAWQGRESDAAAIETILERFNEWGDKPDKQAVKQSSERILDVIRLYDGKTINGILMVIGKDYVEFSGGVSSYEVLKIDESRFAETLMLKLEKIGFPKKIINEIKGVL